MAEEDNDYDEEYGEEDDLNVGPGGGASNLMGRLDVPIDINVELGTLALNTDDAMSMQEGDLLTLETSCPGEVSLVYQGRELGRGKLVDIDGHLGVQITHNWCRK